MTSSPSVLDTPRSISALGGEFVASLPQLSQAGFPRVTCKPGVITKAFALIAAQALRVFSRNGAGRDAIALRTAQHHYVNVELAKIANTPGVAEIILGFMVSSLSGIPQSSTSMNASEWTRLKGSEPPDITLGLIRFESVARLGTSTLRSVCGRFSAYYPHAGINRYNKGGEASPRVASAPSKADGSPRLMRRRSNRSHPSQFPSTRRNPPGLTLGRHSTIGASWPTLWMPSIPNFRYAAIFCAARGLL